MLQQHFASICRQENVEAEEEALHLIAGAAEGSVRDGLSILDQAIAHADMGDAGKVTAEQVRDMLGLADKTMQRRLMAALLAGDGGALLDLVAQQFALGIEPISLMRGAMELVHRITVAQIGKGLSEAGSAEEREAVEGWAKGLTAGQLHRLWQLLLKGHDEVRTAPDPLVAAQMALLRVMHASDMPDPGALIRKLEHLAANPGVMTAAGVASPTAEAPAAPAPALPWNALVEWIERSGNIHFANMIRMQVRVIALGEDSLRYALAPGFKEDLTADLRKALGEVTGRSWTVEREAEGGEPTMVEVQQAKAAEAKAALRAHPLVDAVYAAFPNATQVNEDDEFSGRKNRSQRA
jgi:DNA polymerase-3 subunit gamma/tau